MLVGTSISFIICMTFEFLLMVLGMSLIFDKCNILQIFMHFLGCLFTAWFLLDTWRYNYMWYLWAFFGVLPFLIEILILVSAVRFTKNINMNLRGKFKAWRRLLYQFYRCEKMLINCDNYLNNYLTLIKVRNKLSSTKWTLLLSILRAIVDIR